MKSFLALILMLSSFCSWANPFLNTKERVRLELWYMGVEKEDLMKKESVHKTNSPRLPVELEQSLLKF